MSSVTQKCRLGGEREGKDCISKRLQLSDSHICAWIEREMSRKEWQADSTKFGRAVFCLNPNWEEVEDGGEDVFLSVVVPVERAALGPEDSTYRESDK